MRLKAIPVQDHCRHPGLAIRHTSDKGSLIPHMRPVMLRGGYGRFALISGNARNLPPVPEGENIQILVTTTVGVKSAVAHIKTFQVIFVHQFRTDHPVGSHLDRGHPGERAMDSLVGVPEMFMPDESASFSSGCIVILQEFIHLPDIFFRATHHQSIRGKSQTERLMDLSAMKQLPVECIDIHISFPDNPAVAVQKERVQNALLLFVQCKNGSRKQTGIGTHLRQESQSVVAELLLRAVLVKTPVAFDPLLHPGRNLGDNGITGGFYQSEVVLQQSAYQHIPGKPDLILPRHAELGIFHHFDGRLLFLRVQLFFHQEESRAQCLGNTDLVIPPVLTDRFLPEPVAQRLVNDGFELRSPMAITLFGPVQFGKFQHTVGMFLVRPARTFPVVIVNIRPGTVFPNRLHISRYLFHVERITLVKFHNDLVGNLRLGLYAGQEFHQRGRPVVIRYKRADIILLKPFQFLLRCLCKQWNRYKRE